jgi:hypothetical protein
VESWIDRLAAALGEDPPSAGETSDILTMARDVAHRVERKITPVSTYLLGIAVGRRLAEGASRGEALAGREAILRSALPDEPAEEEAASGGPEGEDRRPR